jgi:ribosomal protein L11 methyltransferase
VLAALVDDFSPVAIEPRDADVRVFFGSAHDRDAAQRALASRFDVAATEVSDDDWARRSQEGLQSIRVGRITVVPSSKSIVASLESQVASLESPGPQSPSPQSPSPLTIVITPSMGFGTGHHATTRLCLAALQTLDLRDRDVLDVGTGSGVLAIAADRLGAARAAGIDYDEDAIQSARENLMLNPATRHVAFDLLDLTASELPQADVVTANLTGALLIRSASGLAGAVRPGGTLILSGMLTHEREEVCRAFAGMVLTWEGEEDDWVGIAVKKP